jgi:hypothetical protein
LGERERSGRGTSRVGESRHPCIAADDGREFFQCEHILQAAEAVRGVFCHDL